jgi:hypothetical protein
VRRDKKETIIVTPRARSLFFLFAALIASCAVAAPATANSIEAPFWDIGGHRLEANETKSATIKTLAGTEMILHGSIHSEAIEIRCKKEVFEKSLFIGSEGKHDGKTSGALELAECSLYAKEGKQQSECTVETIKSHALAGRLWLEGTEASGGNRIVIEFSPTEGSLIAEVVISGKSCTYEGTYKLEGDFAANISPEKEGVQESKFIFPVKPIEHIWQSAEQKAEKTVSLIFNGVAASFQGEQGVELSSKEEFNGYAPHEKHEYMVTGGTLSAKIEGTSGASKFKTEIGSTKVTINCKKDKITGEIEKEAKSKATITYEECSVEGLGSCVIPNIKIKAIDLLVGALVSEDEFKEEGEGPLANIVIETCALKGTFHLTGTQTCKLPGGEIFAVSHEVTCTTAGSKLKLGTKPATYEGAETVQLESKKEWVAF